MRKRQEKKIENRVKLLNRKFSKLSKEKIDKKWKEGKII